MKQLSFHLRSGQAFIAQLLEPRRISSPLFCFRLALFLLLASTFQPAQAYVDAEIPKLQAEIAASRITDGPYAGGYKLNHAAAGMSWYFTATGLRGVVKDPTQNAGIEDFFNLWLAKTDPQTGLVDDVANVSTGQTQLADADDSLCSMMIILLGDWNTTSQGKAWFGRNRTRVKAIATQVLLNNRLSNGLISALSKARSFAPGTSQQALQNSAYILDSEENHTALGVLGGLLKQAGDGDSSKFTNAATIIAQTLTGLYSSNVGAFWVLDADKKAYPSFYPADKIRFYPHRVIQIGAQLYSVPVGNSKALYDGAWNFFNAGNDAWTKEFPKDGSNSFPLMIISLVALKRGLTSDVKTHLAWHAREFNAGNPAFEYIQEVGTALRLRKMLGGTAPSVSATATPRPTATATPRPTATPVPTPNLTGLAVYQREGDFSTDARYSGIRDSSLVLADFGRKTVNALGPWNLLFARNPHFNSDGSAIVFTAYTNDTSGFDIFLWKVGTSTPINLTAGKFGGEARDEDVSWLNGMTLLFKRGSQIYKMTLDAQGNSSSIAQIPITSSGGEGERSGPILAPAGNFIMYWKFSEGNADVYRVPVKGGTETPMATVPEVSEYYPVSWKTGFALMTRWLSPSQQSDQIYSLNLNNRAIAALPFNSKSAENADAAPINERYVMFSSTRAGSAEYNLYVGDAQTGQVWTMAQLGLASANSGLRELGADYYSAASTLREVKPTAPPTTSSAGDG